MTLDLSSLVCQKNGRKIALALLECEKKLRESCGDSGYMSNDDSREAIKEVLSNYFVLEAERDSVVDTILQLLLLKSVSMAMFGPSIRSCVTEHELSVKDTVFAVMFAAANINVISEMSTPNPTINLHSRDDFVKIAEVAYDYMQLHHKSMLKYTGGHTEHDN